MSQIDKLYQAVKTRFEQDKIIYFNDHLEMSDVMQNHFNVISKEVIEDKLPMSVIIEELADYFFMVDLYILAFSQKERSDISLSGGSYWYSLFLLNTLNCSKENNFSPVVLMRKACHLWSSLFLTKQYDDAAKVGDDFINSINGTHANIIRYGCRLYPEAWFLTDLYSLSTGKIYDKERADYPNDMSQYIDVLDEWDTDDLVKVDSFISLLSEMHLLTTEYDNEDDIDEEYLTFHHPLLKLYPYEAITYLAIREINGLKNPKKFSHLLMNTPIAKFFLDLKNPLEKPKDLPYIKELLGKLKEKCPDIEISE